MEPKTGSVTSGSQGVAIRPVEPGDIEALWEMVRDFAAYEKLEDKLTGSAERLAEHLFGRSWPVVECLVALDRGRLVGYAIFYGTYSTFWTRPMIWLEDLYVPEASRGHGIGRALLAAVARIALERGCAQVDWAVLEWNQPAIDFYERLGATRHGGWHGYRVSGEHLRELARSTSSTA
jgi:GNAT superfamily N-acetyltransferase